MSRLGLSQIPSRWWLSLALVITAACYWPGLTGGWLFDDYPNIVDNKGVQPAVINLPAAVNVALSSPASEFKRPLASLSFAANYLMTGLDPYWMKLTNLCIHLLNGLLVYVLSRRLIGATTPTPEPRDAELTAIALAASWMLLPINLTGVLYIVQRMESMANLFVLIGLIGYVTGRARMLDTQTLAGQSDKHGWRALLDRHFIICTASLSIPTALGILAKETAVMLPLYAWVTEWALFRFRMERGPTITNRMRKDWRLTVLFTAVLLLPMVAGLTHLIPGLLNPEAWVTRDFTIRTRLLSEARILVDYIDWTVFPTPSALSFYHDDFVVSSGLFVPWTTFASLVALAALFALMLWARNKQPLIALGIALFFSCHLLTGTVLPLELVYEHRNYFASFGLLLAVVPSLLIPVGERGGQRYAAVRRCIWACLLLWWAAGTAITAQDWSTPLRLARELADRGPESPRAQYELGRTYIISSRYDPSSPFTQLAYAPLERAAALPASSILPQQALIFMNASMGLPLKDTWWDSMIAKLKARKPGVQDESSLATLALCAHEHRCDLPEARMKQAFLAALSHPKPSARLLATYADYAWSILGDRPSAERVIEQAIETQPSESAYRITQIRMLVAQGQMDQASHALRDLESLNFAGRLDPALSELRALVRH